MLGLVLEGGGAKGAFHAGAVKALIERGYVFDGVAGASIGALNGAMIAQGDFDKCYKLWENILPSTFLDVEDDKFNQLFDGDFEKNDFSYAIKLAKNAILNKGLSMEKVELIVNQEYRPSPFRPAGIAILPMATPVKIAIPERNGNTL